MAFWFFCFLILVPLEAARAEQNSLAPLVGMWQVSGVRLNEALMRRPYYNYDDVSLIGRIITFSNQEIETDVAEDTPCFGPNAEVKASTADALVGSSMGGSIRGEAPTVKDFDLPVEGGKTLRIWWITCNEGNIGPDTPFGPERHNWVAQLTKDQLAMRWYDNTILLLHRLPHDTQPRPTFDCRRAKTPSEKQICSSISLSELDQSVTRAYTTLAKDLEALGETHQLKQLHKTQKKWLAERDLCGGSGECLMKSMQDRLEQLATFE